MSAERDILLGLAGALFAAPASADPSAVAADAARAFGNHCFNPYLTAETAYANIARPGPGGAETFINVERLNPLTEASQ